MAEVTPARISYFLNGALQDIRFHSVIAEAHEATSEVTKYPVQSGFQVSNHAIRKNRKISIEAMITNTPIGNTRTAYQYSSNNSKSIFQVLNDLVNFKIKCEVITNLGIYNPIVFTKFSTKQNAGLVDAMQFTLVGEELQISEAINGTAPSPVSFRFLPTEERAAAISAINAAGFATDDSTLVAEGDINLGEDFIINTTTTLGVSITTTFICTGQDIVTGNYNYNVHTSDTNMYLEANTDGGLEVGATLGGADLSAGTLQVNACIDEEGATELAVEVGVQEVIDTAMGKLNASVHGVVYETTQMSPNDVAQPLQGLTAGCVLRNVGGSETAFPYSPGPSLPTVDNIITGATNFGISVSEDSVTANGVLLASNKVTLVI
jgi:phage baseplate assembly protein W